MFETTELQLQKEILDQHSKNNDVTDALAGWFEVRSSLNIMDLKAGIGANIRALAPILPLDQNWTLCVQNKNEMNIVVDYLTRWAPAFTEKNGEYFLERQGLKLGLKFHSLSSEAEQSSLSFESHNLIVMDGHLNHLTPQNIRKLVQKTAQQNAAFLARLVFDGRIKFFPPQPPDNPFTAAYNRRLMKDIGFGLPAGHLAIEHLSEQFRLCGYTLIEGKSPLHLHEKDQSLMSALLKQLAQSQREIAKGHDKMIDMWLARSRRHMEVGQNDLLALPPDEKAVF
ncbi:MAG: hypothetical protein ACKOW3_02760 [Hyphomicrobium sp.]